MFARCTDFCIETNGFCIFSGFDNFIQPFKSAAADKQNIGGINLDKLLLRVFSAALRRYVSHRSLYNFQKSLLYSFSGYVSGNGGIFRFSGNFVNFVNINNAILSTFYIVICCLNDFQQNIFHILAHITGFGQSGCVGNGKRHIQQSCQRLSQKRLTRTGRTQHKNVALLQFHIRASACQHTFVVVVNCNRKHFFRFILSNDILIQKCLNFLWFQQVNFVRSHVAVLCPQFFLYDFRTDSHTLITDIGAVWTCNQFFCLVFCLSTKGTSDSCIVSFHCHVFSLSVSIFLLLKPKDPRKFLQESSLLSLSMLDYRVNQSICHCLLGCHIIVSFCVSGNRFQSLACILSQNCV